MMQSTAVSSGMIHKRGRLMSHRGLLEELAVFQNKLPRGENFDTFLETITGGVDKTRRTHNVTFA